MTELVDGPGIRLSTGPGRWVLTAATLGSAIAFLDGTVVNVALPRLGDDLNANFADLQWVVTGYLLTLASCILIGGSLGDRLGRRRIFVLGTVWFAIGSLLCGISPNVSFLIAARLFQGVGGALLTPASLAILQTTMHPDDRARAIGAWSGFTGIAGAIGPFLGGWLVSATWRLIFFINLPLAVAVVAISLRHVPESRDVTETGPVDIPGAVLGALGLAGATYGLIERSWAAGIAGIVVFGVFLVVEHRGRDPMLPLSIFRSSQFSAVNVVTFGLYGALSALLFMLSILLQQSLGYSPLLAGAATVPSTVLMLAGSARSGALAQRIGPRWPMTIGTAIVACGLALLVRVAPGQSYWTAVFPGVIVFGLGLTLTVAPLTATAMGTVESRHAGIASGVNNAVSRTAGLFAIALVPLIAGFSPAAKVAPTELVSGFHRVMWTAAAVCALCSALAWTTIRSDALAKPSEPGEEPMNKREPCFNCGSSGTPLVVNADARG